MKKKLRIFSDYPQEIEWKLNEDEYEFVNDDSYDYVIIINVLMPYLKLDINKHNVIGFAHEPHKFNKYNKKFIKYAKQYISNYYLGDPKNFGLPFTKYYGFQNHYNNHDFEHIQPFDKPKNISLIISMKKILPNHTYRRDLAHYILKEGLDIDIWGKGVTHFKNYNNPHLKTEFNDIEPYKDYKFHIAIENCEEGDYITEKFCNCIATKTIPIYIGSDNIKTYFGNDCYIQLKGNIKDDIQILKNILNNMEQYKKNLDIAYNELFYGKCDLNTFLKERWN